MSLVFSANYSAVLVDGEPVDGVQSIAYRVVTEREDIRAVGSDERVAVSFGLRTVLGELTVRSSSVGLDALLDTRAVFQLVASLKKDDGADTPKRTYAFDDCYVEAKSFEMGAGGTASTTYAFTATRVRAE